MHHWKPVEAKNNPLKDTKQTPQPACVPSLRFVDPNQQVSTSSNGTGRQFREFRSPNDPPAWLGNENQHRAITYQSSSDEEDGTLIIAKYPVQARPPLASIQADKDGWYNWDISPRLVQHEDPKERTSALSSNSEVLPNPQTSTSSTPVQYMSPTSADFAADPETVEIGFLEEFDKSLEDEDSDNTGSIDPEDRFASFKSSSSPRVPLPKRASSVISHNHFSDYQANNAEGLSDRDDLMFSYPQGMNDTQLEVATRDEPQEPTADTAGKGLLTSDIPVNLRTDSHESQDARTFTHGIQSGLLVGSNGEEQSPVPASDLSPEPAHEEEHADGINNNGFDRTSPSIPTADHSREQSQRLRLYSTLYADFARDPWKWHERRDIISEMFPSLESGDSEPNGLPSYTEHNVEHQWQLEEKYRDPRDRMHHRTFDSDNASGRHSFEMSPVQHNPNVTKETSQDSLGRKTFVPLEGQQYCQKCRRHFQNTWRMQKHLADSRIHPYYCQVCTVDYRSFRELYTHYAEQLKCRPPELEFGPAKPFLQLLAEYQITGRGEAARKKSAADAKEALELTEDQDEALEEVGSNSRRITSHNSNRTPEAPACPICMVPLMKVKEVLVTACGHVYCSSCILHYFSKERPNCRERTRASILATSYG